LFRINEGRQFLTGYRSQLFRIHLQRNFLCGSRVGGLRLRRDGYRRWFWLGRRNLADFGFGSGLAFGLGLLAVFAVSVLTIVA
tara:strand:- start:107 stop:355 length:249 start_codon:yes stop_codon:yes gene_type:complete